VPVPVEPTESLSLVWVSVYIIIMYCVCGWIGKSVFIIIGVHVEYFLACWTLMHFVAVLGFILVVIFGVILRFVFRFVFRFVLNKSLSAAM
jgi:hypothetical protein